MKKYLITGLIVWLPIGLIYFIGNYLFIWLTPLLLKFPQAYRPDHWIGFHIPLIEWFTTLIIILLTGFMVSYYVGKQLLKLWKQLIAHIPFIRQIFHAIEHVIEILAHRSETSIGKVVLVEYPRKGIWRIGFQMSRPYTFALKNVETVSVVFPSCPEPTSGYLAIVPVNQVIDLNISLSEGLKTTFSFGILPPQVNEKRKDPLNTEE